MVKNITSERCPHQEPRLCLCVGRGRLQNFSGTYHIHDLELCWQEEARGTDFEVATVSHVAVRSFASSLKQYC